MSQRRLLLFAVVVASLLLSGCSGQPPGVSGKVRVKGKPVAAGQIRFVPEESEGSEFSANIHNGKFNVQQNDVAGSYKVLVDIDFVDAAAAAEFYAELEKSTGSKQPRDETKKPHEFREQLRNGQNVLNYNIED